MWIQQCCDIYICDIYVDSKMCDIDVLHIYALCAVLKDRYDRIMSRENTLC